MALRAQALAVLACLVRQRGHVVTRDELMRAVWRDVVVTDGSLAQCVNEIRQALGDSAHRIVQTVPKRGYRLIAEVSFAPGAGPEPGVLAEPRPEGADERPPYPGLASFSEPLAGSNTATDAMPRSRS